MPLFLVLISRAIIFTGVMLLVAACGSSSAAPTLTPVPAVAEPTQALPATEASPIPDTPEARGEVLFKTYLREVGFACVTCHYPTSNKRLIGPGMQDLAARASDYGLSISVEEYIRASIKTPRDFIAPAEPPFAPNAMPIKYGEVLTDAQIDDLVAYILSL